MWASPPDMTQAEMDAEIGADVNQALRRTSRGNAGDRGWLANQSSTLLGASDVAASAHASNIDTERVFHHGHDDGDDSVADSMDDVLANLIQMERNGGDCATLLTLVIPCMMMEARTGGALTLQALTKEMLKEKPGHTPAAVAESWRARLKHASYDGSKLIGFKNFPQGSIWKERADAALKSEWERLVDMCTFLPAVLGDFDMKKLSILPLGDIKLDSNGDYKKTKARAVLDGRKQQRWIEYNLHSSPTINVETLRLLLAIATINGWHIAAADIMNAYINAFLDQFLVSGIPRGVHLLDPEIRAAIDAGLFLLMILRALYGARQAGRCWYDLIRGKLEHMGFSVSNHDPCMFFQWYQGILVILALWVDDIVIFCQSLEVIDAFKSGMERTQGVDTGGDPLFPAFEFGEWSNPITEFTGIGIHYDREKRILRLQHRFYLQNILEMHGLTALRPLSCPAPSKQELDSPPDETDRYILAHYSQILGKLMFSMVNVYISLSWDIGFCTRSMSAPTIQSAKYLKCILRFISNKTDMALVFAAKDRPDEVISYVLCDADFAPNHHSECYSTSGIVTCLSYCCVRSKAKKQRFAGKTTSETELMAASDATTYALGDRWILMELGFHPQVPTFMFMDNNAILAQVAMVRFDLSRTRHIRANFYNTRHACTQKDMVPLRIRTDLNVADVNTKHLISRVFVVFCAHIQGYGDQPIFASIMRAIVTRVEPLCLSSAFSFGALLSREHQARFAPPASPSGGAASSSRSTPAWLQGTRARGHATRPTS